MTSASIAASRPVGAPPMPMPAWVTDERIAHLFVLLAQRRFWHTIRNTLETMPGGAIPPSELRIITRRLKRRKATRQTPDPVNAAKAARARDAKKAKTVPMITFASGTPSDLDAPIEDHGPLIVVVTLAEVMAWCGARGIPFVDWGHLPDVNVIRERHGLRTFARSFGRRD